LNGENNDIKLSNKKSTITKGFKIVIKTKEEECPNLKKDKSFISFDEVMKKINKKKTSKSFIESDEKAGLEEFTSMK